MARLLENLDEPLLVPPTVLAEVCYPDAVRFLRDFLRGGVRLAKLTDTDVARTAGLAERYADLRLGGMDASLIAIAIAERLGIDRIASLRLATLHGRSPRARKRSRDAGGRVVQSWDGRQRVLMFL